MSVCSTTRMCGQSGSGFAQSSTGSVPHNEACQTPGSAPRANKEGNKIHIMLVVRRVFRVISMKKIKDMDFFQKILFMSANKA